MNPEFAHMPIGQINRWIAWAKSHDWGQIENHEPYYCNDGGEIVTASWEADKDDNWAVVTARHKTPAEIRAWAGY